jgi:hypothetical protein
VLGIYSGNLAKGSPERLRKTQAGKQKLAENERILELVTKVVGLESEELNEKLKTEIADSLRTLLNKTKRQDEALFKLFQGLGGLQEHLDNQTVSNSMSVEPSDRSMRGGLSPEGLGRPKAHARIKCATNLVDRRLKQHMQAGNTKDLLRSMNYSRDVDDNDTARLQDRSALSDKEAFQVYHLT